MTLQQVGKKCDMNVVVRRVSWQAIAPHANDELSNLARSITPAQRAALFW